MVKETWESVVDEAGDEAYVQTRSALRQMAGAGVSKAAAVYEVTRSFPPIVIDPDRFRITDLTLEAPAAAVLISRYEETVQSSRELAITEFATTRNGKEDIPAWVPDVPLKPSDDAIVRPLLSNFFGYHGATSVFILNDGRKWSVQCSLGNVTFRLVTLPTNDTPGYYTINTSFSLDTTPLETLIMHRLHVRR